MRTRGLVLALAVAAVALTPHGGGAEAGEVHLVEITGGINPAVAEFIDRAIEQAHREGSAALIIQLDTPGGMVTSTKDIVSDILNAPLPVAVFVAPRGAFAASAGTFITLAGHIAAMAPGTSIGAAHPVMIGPGGPAPSPPAPPRPTGDREDEERPPGPAGRDIMGEKVENLMAAFIESIAAERDRNIEWAIDAVRNSVAITNKQAVEQNVIDLEADDVQDLLQKMDGREVEVGREKVVLETAGATVIRIEMTTVDRFFKAISDPQIAFLLLLGGLLGLYLEFNQPGTFVPGGLGLVSLLMAAFAFQVIPFNWFGLVLIFAGIGLMVAEVFITSFGLLFAGGVACLALGGYMLFDVPEMSDLTVPFLTVILPAVAAFALFGALVVFGVSRSFARPQVAGLEGMVGEYAVADSEISPRGRVFLHGEYWNAEATETIAAGSSVKIVGIDDLLLRVVPAPQATEGS